MHIKEIAENLLFDHFKKKWDSSQESRLSSINAALKFLGLEIQCSLKNSSLDGVGILTVEKEHIEYENVINFFNDLHKNWPLGDNSKEVDAFITVLKNHKKNTVIKEIIIQKIKNTTVEEDCSLCVFRSNCDGNNAVFECGVNYYFKIKE